MGLSLCCHRSRGGEPRAAHPAGIGLRSGHCSPAGTLWPMPSLCSLCYKASNAVETSQPPACAKSPLSTVRLLGTPPDPAAAASLELPGQPPSPALCPAVTVSVTQMHRESGTVLLPRQHSGKQRKE